MIISFILLTFFDYEIKNDYFDYMGNMIYKNTHAALHSRSNSASWYFIQFSYFDKINCREKLSKENKIILDSDSLITSNICLAYLNSDNISKLLSYYKAKRENIHIQPLESNQKLHNIDFNTKKYLNSAKLNYIARFHKSFIPPNNLVGELTKLSEEIYLYTIRKQPNTDSDEILNEILSIPSLRSISPQSPTKLMNRWNSGFVQKNEWPGGFDIYNKSISSAEIYSSGDLRVNHYLNDKGLNGTGQIITIVDSGLDINSPYFSDNSDKPFEYEKVDMDRRKVVYYTRFGNDHDSRDMHGTHVAGISAGNPAFPDQTPANISEYNRLSLYNGVAPGAKVSIIDITTNDDTGTSVLTYPSILLGEALGKVNSKIALCGWGNPSNTEQSYYYDLLAEFNPNRLFVFAAGNSGPGYQTVTTPGDGKNVLTVGALDSLWTSKLETNRNYILTVTSEKVEHFLNLLPYGTDLFYQPTSTGKFMIENAKVISSPSQTGSEVNVFVTSSSDFCNLLDQFTSLSAAIFIGEADDSICPSNKKFDFPVFECNDTEIENYESVSIRVGLSKEDREEPHLSVAQYSSRGPNYVGIQKPDIVAPGTTVFSSDSSFVSASDGTSNAAAYVAGVAALVYEYFEKGFYPTGQQNENNKFEPQADLVRALIVASADPLNEGSRTPDSLSGHGLVNIANVITFGPNMKVFNNIRAGSDQHFFLRFKIPYDQIRKEKVDLRIGCAYKDPSSTNNYLALQTNIDMYLVLPNGTAVHGNHRPEDMEERFSTVERILIYREELLEFSSENNIYELHIMTGGGFSDLPHFGIFSLFISGPFVNTETSPENATAFYDASKFEEEEKMTKPVSDFTFIKASLFDIKFCEFPSYGLFCQHNATEINVNETEFFIYSNTAKLAYINLPLNYSRIVLYLRREPSFSGRLALQFAINAIYEYGTNYPFIVSVNGGSSAIGLGRSMFGANKYVGMRISNMVGTDIKVTASITYEVAIPVATPTQSAVATMPKDVKMHLGISYGLFGLFLITVIVFSVLLCYTHHKIKKNRKIRHKHRANNSANVERPSSENIANELLKDNPL